MRLAFQAIAETALRDDLMAGKSSGTSGFPDSTRRVYDKLKGVPGMAIPATIGKKPYKAKVQTAQAKVPKGFKELKPNPVGSRLNNN